MKVTMKNLLSVAAGVMVSGVALADDGSGYSAGMIALASALCMGLAAFAAASAQGRTAGSAVEGIARNPTSRGEVFLPMILGLVFMEFQALLGFIIAILWYGK